MAVTEQQVIKLYIATFNRAPDKAGLDYWVNSGLTIEQIAQSFFDQPETQALYPDGTTDEAFVTSIYNNVFGREPDAAGLQYWVNELANGMDRSVMIQAMVNGALNDDAQLLENKMAVAQYFVAKGLNDVELAKEVLADVTADPDTVIPASQKIDDAVAGEGQTFTMTRDVDHIVGTDGNDTFIGESATIGTDDTITDTSTSDNDTLNITASTDVPAFGVVNVENINVDFDTLGSNKVDASKFVNATVTLSSDTFGFDGKAEVDGVGTNNVTAGQNITELTVKDITSGLVDTGSAEKLTVEVGAATDSINIKTHGNVALDAITNDYTDLKVEADEATVLDISGSTKDFTGKVDVSGDSNLTLKTTAAKVTAKEVVNNGSGEITVELTDDSDVDLTKADTDKVITDVTYTKNISFKDTIDVTAKGNSNTMTLTGTATVGTGGTTVATATVHLTQAAVAGTESITFTDISSATVDAQKAGTINKIDGSGDASVTVINGDASTLTITEAVSAAKMFIVDGSSAGDVDFEKVNAAGVNAANFTQDLIVKEDSAAAANNFIVVGGKGENAITTETTTGTTTITTQDGKDTLTIKATTGKTTVSTAAGDDTVTATALTTAEVSLDLGDGADNLTYKQTDAAGQATIVAGAGDDKVEIQANTAATISLDAGTGKDTVTVGKLTNDGDLTANLGDDDDIIYIDSAASSTETLVINAGTGNDTVEVTKDADFITATLELNDIESLKIDELAKFNATQLTDKTFAVSSGTPGQDILDITIGKTVTGSDATFDFSKLAMSNDTATAVEYTKITASADADGDEMIIGTHNSTNVIDLGAGDGKETVQLFADAIGTTITEADPSADSAPTATDLAGIDFTKASSFDVAVISNFESADDSLILGNAATATNFASINADYDKTSHNMLDYLAKALEIASDTSDPTSKTSFATNHDLEYLYVWDKNATASFNDGWLLWDSDGNHVVDAAILLVGVETGTNDGSGFVASDIISL